MGAGALEGLGSIDWATLRHAYGEATDLLDLIRMRASRDKQAVKLATDASFGNIWHQDTIYAATPLAARFLCRLLHDKATLDRPGLVLLLGKLARGVPDESDRVEIRDETIREIDACEPLLWRLLDEARDFGLVPYLLAALRLASERVHAEFPVRIRASSQLWATVSMPLHRGHSELPAAVRSAHTGDPA